MHRFADVVDNHGTEIRKRGFLLSSSYNTANVDLGKQNPDLRLQQLKIEIVPEE